MLPGLICVFIIFIIFSIIYWLWLVFSRSYIVALILTLNKFHKKANKQSEEDIRSRLVEVKCWYFKTLWIIIHLLHYQSCAYWIGDLAGDDLSINTFLLDLQQFNSFLIRDLIVNRCKYSYYCQCIYDLVIFF